MTTKSAVALVAALASAGCSSNAGAIFSAQPATPSRRASGSPIQHVVFIVQENRSFNNLFMGFPGATTATYGFDTDGNKIVLQPVGLKTQWDIDHSSNAFFAACDGTGSLPGTDCKMDGWNNENASIHHPPNPAYAYVPRSEIKPYWTMAKQYVLADETFASNLDASFVAHQYAVAAYASRAVDGPAGPWGCEGGKPDTVPTLTARRTIGKRIVTCFDNPTIGRGAMQPAYRGATTPGASTDDGGIWSAYQADRRFSKARIGTPTSSIPRRSSSPTSATDSSRTSRG